VILLSGLFDVGFYNLQVEAPFRSSNAAIDHYLTEGEAAGLSPNQYLDVVWYRATYFTAADKHQNVLLDFLSQPLRSLRNPSTKFDCSWYLAQYPDVANAGINPLRHYMTDGRREGRAPSSLAAQAELPVSALNFTRAPLPQDGETWISARLKVRAVPAELRRSGPTESAAAGRADIPAGSRAEHFPPKPYIAELQQVGIIGGTRLLLPDAEHVLSDEIATFCNSPGWTVRPHKYEMHEDGSITLAMARRYPSQINRGAHLMHEYAANYFHTVVELLPRLIAADDAGLDPSLPLLIQQGLHPNLLQLLDVVNHHRREVITLDNDRLYTVDELHFISDVASLQDIYERKRKPEETVLHAGLTRRVADRVIAVFAPGAPPKQSRRLYIRRGGRYRGLTNEQAVEEMLVQRGFEIVLLDGLSVAAQVHLFRQAKVVVAPTGAAVTNILWCQPGTPVLVLSAEHEGMAPEIWSQLGAISGCDVGSLSCKRAFDRDDKFCIHDNYAVDLEQLSEAVTLLESEEVGRHKTIMG
jgi:hypothetical protein